MRGNLPSIRCIDVLVIYGMLSKINKNIVQNITPIDYLYLCNIKILQCDIVKLCTHSMPIIMYKLLCI